MREKQKLSTTGSIRVLVVDDEESQIELTKLSLEDADPILEILLTTSAAEALKILQSQHIDCVVSDFSMPGMDGVQFCREVKTHSQTPFIIYTGKGSEEVAEAAFKAGADDYLRKEKAPAHFLVLARRIRHLVERRRVEEALRESINPGQANLTSPPQELRRSGLEPVGDVPWGTHFCLFYRTKQDLVDILVPYFVEGLRGGEYCMWVTADPLEKEDAEASMERAVPDFKQYKEQGQIEILSYRDWYLKGGAFDAQNVLNGWVERMNTALQRGYKGLRLTGNTFWLEPERWEIFTDYERIVEDSIGEHRMIALCTYSLEKCGTEEIVDVIKNHQFALLKRLGKWEKIESSDSRRFEGALRSSEDRFHTLFKSMTEGFALCKIILDDQGKPIDFLHIDVNPAYEKLVGIPQGEVEGKTIKEIIPGIERYWIDALGTVALTGEPATMENPVGQRRRISAHAYSPKTGYFVIIFDDVTERKKAEEELQERERQLTAILTGSPIPMFVVDSDVVVTQVNPSVESFTGREAGQLIGLRAGEAIRCLHSLDDPDGCGYGPSCKTCRVRGSVNETLNDGREIHQAEAELRLMNDGGGKTVNVLVSTIPVTISGETKVLVCIEDVTKLKEKEVELEKANHELQANHEELQQSSEEIQAINEELRETNEYLGAAEEELRASNEELQSKNEELRTTEEELRVSNEQLQQLNLRLDATNEELKSSEEDLQKYNATLESIVAERTREITIAKDRLEAASLYNRSLLEASLDPLVTISAVGKITDVNLATELVTGVERERLIGSDFSDYFTEPEKARIGYRRVFEKGQVTDYPLAIRHTSGKVTDVLYNAAVYRNPLGEIIGIFAAARDVTSLNKAEANLRAASLYTRSLIEASQDPLVTISAEGKITDVNEATVQVTGVTRRKLIGSDFSDYFTDPEKARIGYLRVFEKGQVTDYPLVIRHTSGKVTDVLYNATVYRKPDGQIAGIFAAARDVTSLKRAEAELIAASLYTRSLIEASLDPLVTINPAGRITDVNAATELVTGMDRTHLIGSDFSDYFTEPEKARIGYRRVFEEGQVRDYPLAIRHSSGKVTDVLYNATVYRDEAGEVKGIFAAARDVTRRKEVEERLQAASHYSRSLIEASLDPLVTINADGKITDVNEATIQATGVPREKLIGSEFADYFTEPEKARDGRKKIFAEGYIRDYPLAIRHTSGKVTEVLYNATVYKDTSGEVAGIFAAARDVTEKNRLQEKLLHAERMEAMSKLTAMIAHDLRNPLSSASQAAEMALIYPERTTKMLGLIRDSINRSLNLIEELRSGTREIVLRPEETEITSLIRKVADENPPPQGVKLRVTLPEETGNAKIDSELIHRVFENLTRNAYEAMPGGGELTMSATLNNGDIRIDFSDTGTGIPPEAVSRIFDTFYTTKAKGLGLGLAFSKRAVEAHGGKLTFTTTYGKGTTFTVTLPREIQ